MKAMFHPPPDTQPPKSEFRENHCCCDPGFTVPSTFESPMNPPLDHPPSSSLRSPFTCMRRKGAPCETAQRFMPPVGVTVMLLAERQNVQVALPPIQSASE